MAQFLDMQIEEKKKGAEQEKEINHCQAHIWKEDTKKFYEQERDLNEKVKFELLIQIKSINKMNFSFLKNQIDSKTHVKKVGMTDSEFLLNKNLLKSIKKGKQLILNIIMQNCYKKNMLIY